MNCPNCRSKCRSADFFCRTCGTALNHADTPKQGSLLIPAVILVVIVLCGLIAFFVTTDTGSSIPVKPDVGASYSAASAELSYFSITPDLEKP